MFSLSLSLSLYIYIYKYIKAHWPSGRWRLSHTHVSEPLPSPRLESSLCWTVSLMIRIPLCWCCLRARDNSAIRPWRTQMYQHIYIYIYIIIHYNYLHNPFSPSHVCVCVYVCMMLGMAGSWARLFLKTRWSRCKSKNLWKTFEKPLKNLPGAWTSS